MSTLYVRLFGRISLQRDGQEVHGIEAQKVQELFSYLLLHRDRIHSREVLAGLLWGDLPTAQSKKSLRQTLWHLQAALDEHTTTAATSTLRIEPDWIQINPDADISLDVAIFEQTFANTQKIPGGQLDTRSVWALQEAVSLYRGDLLEGWYHDWCLFERERLQNAYLAVLDKLMAWCEVHGAYEAGLEYGNRILRVDRARERTHRRLMRLYYLADDRAAALRQYERCITALKEELQVGPARRTVELYRHICDYRFEDSISPCPTVSPPEEHVLPPILYHLKQLTVTLGELQRQLYNEIAMLEEAVTQHTPDAQDVSRDVQETPHNIPLR